MNISWRKGAGEPNPNPAAWLVVEEADPHVFERGLSNGLQPLLGDEREQLERSSAWMFLAALPLADKSGCNVKITCEYRLTRLLAHADPRL
jgi:hypothetical protein